MHNTAQQHDRSQLKGNPWTLKEVTAAGLFAALTAVSAMFTVPLPFVPMTLQVLVTLLAGAVLGARAGSLSQAVYVAMGVVGLPVFSGRGAGIQHLLGPTGGYLIGFVLAPWVVAKALGPRRPFSMARGAVAMGLGLLVIHVAGVLGLSVHVGSLNRAVAIDAAFIPVDLIKAVAAFAIARGLEARGVVMREAVAGSSYSSR